MRATTRGPVVVTAMALLISGQVGTCSAQDAARPNILFIFTDDQPQSCMGCMGNEHIQTPNLDRLAADGVLFTNGDATLKGQLLGIATIFVWVFVTSFVVWFIIKMIMGIRVSEEEEDAGVDLSECGLEAYPEFVGSKGSGL